MDHGTLLSRLQNLVVIQGTALDWSRCYLESRSMCISIAGFESVAALVSYGVPQGSVLGPLLFSLHLLPLGSILKKHVLSFHLYADDSQIYLPLKKKDGSSLTPLVSWMALSFQNFNEIKTEAIVFELSGWPRCTSLSSQATPISFLWRYRGLGGGSEGIKPFQSLLLNCGSLCCCRLEMPTTVQLKNLPEDPVL